MISHWRDKKQGFVRNFEIDTLRKTLEINENKYVRPSGFLKRVLLPAQKELEEKADVWFKVKEPVKEGKRVKGWKIQIFKKEADTKRRPAPAPVKPVKRLQGSLDDPSFGMTPVLGRPNNNNR